MDESSHTSEKLRKAAEKVAFEEERNIELNMELLWQVDKAGALIKDKDSLNQLGGKCRTLKRRIIEVKPAVAKQCNILSAWR